MLLCARNRKKTGDTCGEVGRKREEGDESLLLWPASLGMEARAITPRTSYDKMEFLSGMACAFLSGRGKKQVSP